MMRLRWLGHACFCLTSPAGIRIVMDPFDDSIGYPLPSIEADAVTISHAHFDHSCVDALVGHPVIIRSEGTTQLGDVRITGVPSYHDAAQGKIRGSNTMFSFHAGGIQVAHLGDLGHGLGPEHVLALGHPQILLIPVGGTYTLDAREASRVVELLEPKVVIPMHFMTDALSFPLDTVDNFLQDKKRVRRERGSIIEFAPGSLPDETEIVVLNYI